MPSLLGTMLGFGLVSIGLLHFANRDRRPAERSLFVGSLSFRYWPRVAFALTEVVGGFVILFATSLPR